MFLHNFKYEFLNNIRQKEFIFWMICFPLILGTFFYMAFSRIFDSETLFSEISVAVNIVEDDGTFKSVAQEMENADSPLFRFRFEDKEKSEELLRNGDVKGIITVDKELSLIVMGNGTEQTIIRSFLEQYRSQKQVITDIAAKDPGKLTEVIQSLSAGADTINKNSLSGGNMNVYDAYFMNLITMVALFGMTSGVMRVTQNQGNLSAIGARKCLSPNKHIVTMISSLLAALISQICSVIIATTFVLYILNINMGGNIPMLYLSGVIGSVAGVSIGFFVGSIGRASEGVKCTIATAITMFCCFLSGLMVGNMKPLIEDKCPIINRINPAALISDLFYCLTIYDDYRRYTEKAVSLLIISAIFITGGFLMTRRKTYENL